MLYALGLLNTIHVFITTTLTGQPQFKGNELPGELGTVKDPKTLARNLQMYATFFNPTAWRCLSLCREKGSAEKQGFSASSPAPVQ